MNAIRTPHEQSIFQERSRCNRRELYAYFTQFVTEHKLELFDRIVQNRTRHLTVVLEDIFRSHNASASLRSCECFGIQDVHIIENRHQYETNRDVTLGATRWLNLNYYNVKEDNTLSCIESLKSQGYRIIATSSHGEGCPLEYYNPTRKTALMFGTEMQGLSPTAMEHIDGILHIPIHGFTESFNLSVAVALCLHHLTLKLRESDLDWQLSETEQFDVKFDWVCRAVRKWLPQLEKKFYEQNENDSAVVRSGDRNPASGGG